MAYQSTIPVASDQLAVSQGDLQNNFGAVSTYLNINHVDFNGADQGKHKFITFPLQSTDPSVSPGFSSTEIGFYNYTYSVTSTPELFVSFQDGQIPSTASTLSLGNPAQGTAGWTYLPSGILLMWGATSSVSGTVTQAVLSGANIPTFNQLLSVQITPYSVTADSTFSAKFMGIVNNASFNVYVTSTGGFTWLAIGY